MYTSRGLLNESPQLCKAHLGSISDISQDENVHALTDVIKITDHSKVAACLSDIICYTFTRNRWSTVFAIILEKVVQSVFLM